MQYMSRRDTGFTLVEVLVVAPLVILILSAIVVAIASLSGNSIISTTRSKLQYDVLAALDKIEDDVRLSTKISIDSPHTVTLEGLATDSNPLHNNRRLIDKNTCGAVDSGLAVSSALTYKTTYRIDGDKSLKRLINLDKCAGAHAVWQKNKQEEVLIDNVNEVSIETHKESDNFLRVELTAKKIASGEEVSYTGYLYVKSLNI